MNSNFFEKDFIELLLKHTVILNISINETMKDKEERQQRFITVEV